MASRLQAIDVYRMFLTNKPGRFP